MGEKRQTLSEVVERIKELQEDEKHLRVPSHRKPFWVHVLIIILIDIGVLVQGALMNYYYIRHFQKSIFPYFWFAADVAIALAFTGTLIAAYKHLEKASGRRKTNINMYQTSTVILWHPGALPLSYICWLFYSSIIITKILLMISLGIVYTLNYDEVFGPNILEITVAMSGAIFYLHLEGHTWCARGSAQYVNMTVVAADTAVEICDSANLLNFVYRYHSYTYLGSASSDIVKPIEFVCITTFLLPAMVLYWMTLTDFQAEVIDSPVSALLDVAHLLFIDFPNIAIRIYLWVYHDYYSTMYVVRNIFTMYLILRRLLPILGDSIFFIGYTIAHPKSDLKGHALYIQQVLEEKRRLSGETEDNIDKKDVREIRHTLAF